MSNKTWVKLNERHPEQGRIVPARVSLGNGDYYDGGEGNMGRLNGVRMFVVNYPIIGKAYYALSSSDVEWLDDLEYVPVNDD